MVSPNLDKILKDFEALSEAEQQELRRLLNSRSSPRAMTSHQPLPEHVLRERGVVITVPPAPTQESLARFRSWKPVEMPGGPLSDDIVRDRR